MAVVGIAVATDCIVEINAKNKVRIGKQMYNYNELKEKVRKWGLSDTQISLLNSLCNDVDEFNATFCRNGFELYIDFNDDEKNDSEFSEYGSFSIRLLRQDTGLSDNVTSMLDLSTLDEVLCGIQMYCEGVSNNGDIYNGVADLHSVRDYAIEWAKKHSKEDNYVFVATLYEAYMNGAIKGQTRTHEDTLDFFKQNDVPQELIDKYINFFELY